MLIRSPAIRRGVTVNSPAKFTTTRHVSGSSHRASLGFQGIPQAQHQLLALPLVPRRGMALIRPNSSPAMASTRARNLKMYMDSPGGIAKHYVPPLKWRVSDLWHRVVNLFRSLFASRRIYSKLGTKAQSEFRDNLKELYSRIQVAIAEGDTHALQDLTTSQAMDKLKEELGQPRPKGLKYKWTLHEFMTPRIVSKRIFMVRELKDAEFVQLCVNVRSKQTLEVYDRHNQLIAGSKEPALTNEYCVFERKLDPNNTRWRYAGKVKPS